MIKKLFDRLWHSSTFNTWLSYGTKTLSVFIVLPLILKKFDVTEVAVWYLFSTIISLQSLVDMGFRITFIRLIAYAKGGAKEIVIKISDFKSDNLPHTNWELIGRIYATMNVIYVWLAGALLILLLTIGSLALAKPVSLVPDSHSAWIAWAIVSVVTSIRLIGNIFSNYLEGLNHIALVRRLKSLTSMGSIVTSITVLIFTKSLLYLVIANQLWVVVAVIRDYQLCKYVEDGAFLHLEKDHKFDKVLFKNIWHPAWRSGLSSFMSTGLNNLSSVLYAQVGNSVSVASYLLALRIISQLEIVSMAPFYSKIPWFSNLRIKGDLKTLFKKAQQNMFVTNMIFVVGIIIIGIFSSKLIVLMHSHTPWVDTKIWILISFAYFVHRYGAMHIQLYNTTNHIISHIADGVSGAIFICTALLLIKKFELYAIPIGMLAGYLGFYAWYAAYHSLKSLNTSFYRFERKAVGLPMLLFVGYIITFFIGWK